MSGNNDVVKIIIAFIGVIGTIGGAVFSNITKRKMDDDEDTPAAKTTPSLPAPTPSELVVAESITATLEDYRRRITTLESTLAQERKETLGLNEEHYEAQRNKLRKIAEMERKIGSLSARVEALTEDVSHYKAEMALKDRKIDELTVQLVQYKLTIQKLESELKHIKDQGTHG